MHTRPIPDIVAVKHLTQWHSQTLETKQGHQLARSLEVLSSDRAWPTVLKAGGGTPPPLLSSCVWSQFPVGDKRVVLWILGTSMKQQHYHGTADNQTTLTTDLVHWILTRSGQWDLWSVYVVLLCFIHVPVHWPQIWYTVWWFTPVANKVGDAI